MAGEGNNGPGFEIPQQPEQLEQNTDHVEQAEQRQETAVETVGKPQEQAKQPPKLIPQDQTTQVVAPDDQQTQAPATAQTDADDDIGVSKLHAKDGDLIEKEWVARAKTIIAKTADDPHTQKHQVSKMKAAYIQKRFNKTVKTDEAKA